MAVQLYRPQNVSCTYAGVNSAYTITTATWLGSSYNKLPSGTKHAGRDVIFAIEYGAPRFYMSKSGSSYFDFDYVDAYFPNASAEKTITVTGTSTYPAGAGTMTVVGTNPIEFRCSNASAAQVTIDGVAITAATSALNLLQNPNVTVTGDDISRGAKVYLVNTETNAKIDITSGGTISGTFYGSYKIICSTLARDYPSWIYNDIKGDGLHALYSPTSNQLIYQFKVISTNEAMVMTEWVFVQDEYGSNTNPHVYINDKDVCQTHSTTHIIDYDVSPEDAWEYDMQNHCYKIPFTMSIHIIDPTASGGDCTFRCWINDDGQHATYDSAETTQKASIDGNQDTTARFILRIDKYDNKKTLAVNTN